jgi:hypothetical protein
MQKEQLQRGPRAAPPGKVVMVMMKVVAQRVRTKEMEPRQPRDGE